MVVNGADEAQALVRGDSTFLDKGVTAIGGDPLIVNAVNDAGQAFVTLAAGLKVGKAGGAPEAAVDPTVAAAAEGTLPSRIYRGATQGNPNHVALREGEGAVSFRNSMSKPLPEPGSPPQPVLRTGRNYIEVDTSKLPPETVVHDGGTVVNGQLMPPGHVSVTATPEQIINATVGGGKFPK